jgi:hypothetical protein
MTAAWVIEPVGMEDAARALGVSRRKLVDLVKAHPLYEVRGQKKIFYPEHIDGIRRALRCQEPEKTGTRSGRKKRAGVSISRSAVNEFADDFAFVTRAARG